MEQIRFLAGMVVDYMGSCKDDDIPALNRRIGYCEAIVDLIMNLPEPSANPATTNNKGGEE